MWRSSSRCPRSTRAPSSGFGGLVELNGHSLTAEGWILEMEDKDGSAHELPMPKAIDRRLGDLGSPVRSAMESAPQRGVPVQAHISRRSGGFSPGLHAGRHRLRDPIRGGPESPEITIVVPLYRQLKHLEIQLSQFANDPEWLRRT